LGLSQSAVLSPHNFFPLGDMTISTALNTEVSQTPQSEPLIRVEGLTVHFNAGRSGFWGQNRLVVHAVDDVSFTINAG
jgi:ABC-type glutathione transport system ATPase component